jgi:hypothetical protein
MVNSMRRVIYISNSKFCQALGAQKDKIWCLLYSCGRFFAISCSKRERKRNMGQLTDDAGNKRAGTGELNRDSATLHFTHFIIRGLANIVGKKFLHMRTLY